jgi:hypothetical protein
MDAKRFQEIVEFLAMEAFLAAKREGLPEQKASGVRYAVLNAAEEVKSAGALTP